MYSPRRNVNDYELQTSAKVASPLRIASSPFYNAVKSAQNKATHDFDRFYENLQHKLSPSTSESRFVKRTPYTTEALRSRLNQGAVDSQTPINRTSLTPFFERHSINGDAQTRYNHNIFEESDIEGTPSLLDNVEDTPLTYTSLSKRNSFYQSPKASRSTSILQRKAADESRRMDQLDKSLSKIRRLSSFLAGENSNASIFSEEDNTDEEEPLTRPILTPRKTPISSTVTNEPFINQQLATPPQSIDYHKTMITSRRPRSPTPKITTPRRSFINSLNSAKLKSTETITTPGGSRVANRFWKEIHGPNTEREPSPLPKGARTPIPERTSMLKNKSNSWANDDGFWSSDVPAASSLNHKLLQIAQQEKEEMAQSSGSLRKRSIFNDDDEESLYRNRLFKAQKATHCVEGEGELERPQNLFAELETASNRDEIMKRNNIPKGFPNVLAELKAKHGNRLIDDSDSYKFA